MPRITILFVLMMASSCVSSSRYLAATADNRACHAELASRNDDVKSLRSELAALSHDVGERDAQLGAREEKLQAVQKQMGAYKTCSTKLASLIEMGSLSVEFRNGQVLINLPADVLFPSGSATLSNGGMVSLNEVVKALYAYKDRRFIVAGHTDNRPLRANSRFASNWELSQKRALNVVDYMVSEGFHATSLAAAGYGDDDPIASNDTPVGRAKNRRIEIILVPDLTKDMLPEEITKIEEKAASDRVAQHH